ncbi:MAG: RelA/SpoT family protein [Spirochaetaceae bacterium]|jgi:guanosine-3',5'-bis(diphosphate) 3'-pyrophosphohydrolase|nr:RelA/SpoT family protein [Spirochaetaceae bacterium]
MVDPLILDDQSLERVFQSFEKQLTHYKKEERKIIMRAARWAHKQHIDQKRASGEPYIIHPIRAAEILIALKMDSPSIIGALLHDVLEDTDISPQILEDEFGTEVKMLVEGVTKIDIMEVQDKNLQQNETLRKMIFAMVQDIRVIFIKLADKRHNMNTLQFMPEHKQKRISRECLEIYAPLAGKLGMNALKSELEDLSLKYLHPLYYREIKQYLSHKKDLRKRYLLQVKKEIENSAAKEKMNIEVKSRAKHFYSIYRKMKYKGKDLEEIYDLLGIRILCKNKNDCYGVLGMVHHLWPPLEGRFKDYIAMPKENNYQSLHTTVMCYEHRPLEIQIRTFNMEETAQYGLAAHFLYKEGKKHDQNNKGELDIIKKFKDISKNEVSTSEFMDSIKQDLLPDTILVYTPKGEPVILPKGSTAIEFAYHIHSEVGSHCMGAKADGAIIPLIRPLKNTQTVEVLTSPSAHPHVNWLRFAKTHRARSKIRYWINKHNEDFIVDRNIVAKAKKGLKQESRIPIQEIKTPDFPDLIGDKIVDREKVALTIDNERNLMIKMAQCCHPTPGDQIIGFISRGRGIIVHRTDCKNLSGINEFEERKIEVEWESMSSKFTQRFKIHARRTQDLFSEIEGSIRKYNGHIISGSIDENDRGEMDGFLTIEMEHKDDAKKILKNMRSIPSLISIIKTLSIIQDHDNSRD